MAVKRPGARRTYNARGATERALKLVPPSGLVEDLVETVSVSASRQVTLIPYDLGRGEPTGLWIATAAADYIVYPVSASPAERTAIICHELSHILLRHEPEGEAARLSELAAVVAPDIDPSIAQRMLARHGYRQDVEVEAEILATRLVARLSTFAEQARVSQDTISDRLR